VFTFFSISVGLKKLTGRNQKCAHTVAHLFHFVITAKTLILRTPFFRALEK
jgi:hypothetical protein